MKPHFWRHNMMSPGTDVSVIERHQLAKGTRPDRRRNTVKCGTRRARSAELPLQTKVLTDRTLCRNWANTPAATLPPLPVRTPQPSTDITTSKREHTGGDKQNGESRQYQKW